MTNKELKVILDTNLWISFLITKTLAKLDKPIKQGQIRLLFSEESLSEFLQVAIRPKFKEYFSKRDIAKLLEYIGQFGDMVEVKSEVNICRDKKDNFWLELAKDGKADYLITGDTDLLVLETFENTKIITLTDFLTELS